VIAPEKQSASPVTETDHASSQLSSRPEVAVEGPNCGGHSAEAFI
jgi:hypothetical protein